MMTSRITARAILARLLVILLAAAPLASAAAQETVTYTYDARGRLTKVDHGTTGPNANVLSTYTYDAADNRCDLIIKTDHTSATGSCPRVVTLSPTTLPNGTVGTSYSNTITASGGTSPYTYATTAGTLPVGLSLNSTTGVLSGTPTTAAAYSFTITGKDSASNAGSQAYNVTIAAAPITLTLAPTTLPNGTVGTAYSQTITASGGTSPYTFSVSSGTLPAGLTLSSGGVLSGTPTTAASYSFTAKATDSVGNTGTQAYSMTIGSGVQPPVANPDSASTTACGTVTVNVVANDTDPGGNLPLQVTAIVSSTKGDSTIVGTTSIQYSAIVASGTGVVTYTVTNSKGASSNGTLTVGISGGVCP